jgi:hypothetical protein
MIQFKFSHCDFPSPQQRLAMRDGCPTMPGKVKGGLTGRRRMLWLYCPRCRCDGQNEMTPMGFKQPIARPKLELRDENDLAHLQC